MDDYGIAASALAGLKVYQHAARQSGRTTRMIAALVDGANIWCLDQQEADWLRRQIKDRRPELKGWSVKPMNPAGGAHRAVPPAYFTESWVARAYECAIGGLSEELARAGTGRWAPELPPWEPPPVTMGDWPAWRG